MKQLKLKSAAFRYLEKSYGEWLDILGFSPSTLRSLPSHIREFLHYMEQRGCTELKQIDVPVIRTYYRELSQRPNQRRGGGLSNNYLNIHLLALDLLLEYLRKQAGIVIPPVGIPRETPNPEEVIPLSEAEVLQLYRAVDTYGEHREEISSHPEIPAMVLRDKAMLAVFYDCGLRRSEGASLNLSDIHYDHRLLEVREGKGGQPRLVPLGKTTLAHLQNYCFDGRPYFLKTGTEEAFFLNNQGNRAKGGMFDKRLKIIQQYVESASLRHRRLYLHILRHSIATHLLYRGMSLEKVAQFLGHRSLENTQIYTHLVEKAYG